MSQQANSRKKKGRRDLDVKVSDSPGPRLDKGNDEAGQLTKRVLQYCIGDESDSGASSDPRACADLKEDLRKGNIDAIF